MQLINNFTFTNMSSRPRDVEVEVEKPIDVDEFKKIMNECLENNNDR